MERRGLLKNGYRTGVMTLARYYEPEHDEVVEHDTVMVLIDGKLVEVTADDAEVRK